MLNDFEVTQISYFKWFQLIHAIPKSWKLAVLNDKGNFKNIIYLNHRLIKKSQFLAYSKKTILYIYIILKNKLPTFSYIFHNLQVEWKEIYLLPHKDSIDTNLRIFQYKLLNNVLYLNKQIFIFNKKDIKLCSYCRFKMKQLIQFL